MLCLPAWGADTSEDRAGHASSREGSRHARGGPGGRGSRPARPPHAPAHAALTLGTRLSVSGWELGCTTTQSSLCVKLWLIKPQLTKVQLFPDARPQGGSAPATWGRPFSRVSFGDCWGHPDTLWLSQSKPETRDLTRAAQPEASWSARSRVAPGTGLTQLPCTPPPSIRAAP